MAYILIFISILGFGFTMYNIGYMDCEEDYRKKHHV